MMLRQSQTGRDRAGFGMDLGVHRTYPGRSGAGSRTQERSVELRMALHRKRRVPGLMGSGDL